MHCRWENLLTIVPTDDLERRKVKISYNLYLWLVTMKRSEELKRWIAKHSSHEELLNNLKEIPESLKKELLQEALEINDDIRRNYEMRNFGTQHCIRELIALKSYFKTKEVFGNIGLDMPLLNLSNTPSFNVIDTSSLFAVFKPKSKRYVCNNELLVSRKNISIRYTGEVLYQFDWDVFHMLITLSRGDLSKAHTTTPGEILCRLGYADSGGNYARLEQSVKRLHRAEVVIQPSECKKSEVGVGGSIECVNEKKSYRVIRLISAYEWDRGSSIRFALDHQIRLLTGSSKNEYGMVDWNTRNKLQQNELAKKLQAMFSGHQNMQNHSVARLRDLCRLSSDISEFTRHLKRALDELVLYDVIHSYWLYKPRRGEMEKRYLRVWKKNAPCHTEPVPTQKGDYFTKAIILSRKKKGNNV